ncbi:MAG: hypothetical protein ACRELA_18305 [Candidatus Rokuibacteriota bacterium]
MDRNRDSEPKAGSKRKEKKAATGGGPKPPLPETIEAAEEEGINLERPERDLIRGSRAREDADKSPGGFGDERSDRESGRPVQLGSEAGSGKRPGDQPAEHRERKERKGDSRGRADREPGLSGTQQAGRSKK